jgi:hypothetical protein
MSAPCFGCVNVPVALFDERLGPLLGGRRGVVYLLPQVVPLARMFSAVDAVPGPR